MPPPEAFLAIPEYRSLGAALAAYDLVGLQTTSDVGNAIACLRRSNGAQVLPSGRLGIDSARFELTRAPVTIDVADFAPGGSVLRPAGVRRVLGVDRLDYTKGLPQKFRAFERLLEAYPQFRRTTVLAQIAAPTRESVEVYADIRQELEGISGAVNGAYGDVDWVPIHYVHRAIPRKRLGALYRSAAVGLITPLRDGMNLTAKEYVAAQDGADPGVLVLSMFAGAAEDLKEALLVNPYCASDVADALATALTMPLAERVERHKALMEVVSARDSRTWAMDFVRHLERAARFNRAGPVSSVA
jgi:trehalose 6-phosphate synthase